jgi:hypothetical protein
MLPVFNHWFSAWPTFIIAKLALLLHYAAAKAQLYWRSARWGLLAAGGLAFATEEVHFWCRTGWLVSTFAVLGGAAALAYLVLRAVPLDPQPHQH